jgi:DMSO/TMAO reductase YedYZ molybdopterin-dependent catalytic subunit
LKKPHESFLFRRYHLLGCEMNSRRQFFFIAAGGLAWAQSPNPNRPKQGMIVRSVRPEDLEMPPSGFLDYITPIELFYVRTHVLVPDVNLQDWRLKVEGQVQTPLTLTMDELRKMPSTELVSVLECAGNGRSLYSPTVAGVQWVNGAVGNGRWRGVRLADVLRRAGIRPDGVDVAFDGADTPIGIMEDFQRALPVAKALDPNTLLAYEMNGETLPAKHGFPLRVVAPGWAGDHWMKWVTSVRVLDKPFEGWWMKNAYRHPGRPIVPGTALAQDAMTPLKSLRVKSIIASPADGSQALAGKPLTIRGAAWSGDGGPVGKVDVSVDNGRSWTPARLSSEQSRFGWRLWEFSWTPTADQYHTVLARARDTSGDVQPSTQEWNPSGYVWNAVARANVEVVKELRTPASPAAAPASSLAEPSRFNAACVGCHESDVIQQQRLTRAQWDREINKMTGWGATVSPDEREAFLNYLAGRFGPRP